MSDENTIQEQDKTSNQPASPQMEMLSKEEANKMIEAAVKRRIDEKNKVISELETRINNMKTPQNNDDELEQLLGNHQVQNQQSMNNNLTGNALTRDEYLRLEEERKLRELDSDMRKRINRLALSDNDFKTNAENAKYKIPSDILSYISPLLDDKSFKKITKELSQNEYNNLGLKYNFHNDINTGDNTFKGTMDLVNKIIQVGNEAPTSHEFTKVQPIEGTNDFNGATDMDLVNNYLKQQGYLR